MWLQVSFDLPVKSEIDRKKAADFRTNLLKIGFEMAQFSLYLRYCRNMEIRNKYVNKIKEFSPKNGKIHILTFTDTQYENIISIHASGLPELKKKPQRLTTY